MSEERELHASGPCPNKVDPKSTGNHLPGFHRQETELYTDTLWAYTPDHTQEQTGYEGSASYLRHSSIDQAMGSNVGWQMVANGYKNSTVRRVINCALGPFVMKQ